jgi:hypothetical protein
LSDNRYMPDLVTEAELQERLGGKVNAEVIFLTALAMLVDMNGGSFSYNEQDVETFKQLHLARGQLGIQIEGRKVTVFMYDAPLADA